MARSLDGKRRLALTEEEYQLVEVALMSFAERTAASAKLIADPDDAALARRIVDVLCDVSTRLRYG